MDTDTPLPALPEAGGKPADGPQARLAAIHARVDAEAARLQGLHAERLQCRRGCSMCCVDGIEVAAVEADLIRARHADLLATGRPHAPGLCALLDEAGACRIYESRPYVCRSQGLPLRWLDQDEAGQFVELRDICPLNEAGPPVEDLPGDQCWSVGWAESALGQLQAAVDGVDPLGFDDDDDWGDDEAEDEGASRPAGGARRVALRDLFARRADAGRGGDDETGARRTTPGDGPQGERGDRCG